MAQRLMNNEDFLELIMRSYIDDGIRDFVLDDNVDHEGVRDELKARRILYLYIYGIIERAEILKKEQMND